MGTEQVTAQVRASARLFEQACAVTCSVPMKTSVPAAAARSTTGC